MGTIASAETEPAGKEKSRRQFPLNRFLHRIVGILASLLLLWIAVTGIGMQLLDLKAILTHEPPTDPQELSMQEGMYGPANFAVIQVSDFSAPTLPQGFDIGQAISTVLQAVHTQQNPGSGPGASPGAGAVASGPRASGPGGGRAARVGDGPGGNPKGSLGVRPVGGPNAADGVTSSGRPGRGQGAGPNAGPGAGPGGGQRIGQGGEQYNPLAWIELRMANGIPIGQAMVGTKLEAFNAQTGEPVAPVPPVDIPQGGRLPPSLRQKLKTLHRFWNRQDAPGVYVEFLAGLILWTLILSGLIMYFRLWSTRWRQGRPQPFWLTGGGLWRALHRVISVVAAVFLMWMAFTGTWIGFESSVGPVRRLFAPKPVVFQGMPAQAAAGVQQGQQVGQLAGPGGRRRNPVDFILPLRDAEVREMTATTLASMQQLHPTLPIKAIRLRTYGQTKQGVVITGGDITNQYVFNADTGQPASLSEQGYPEGGFPFGTQVHENIKHLHSGDYFGIPARLMNLFAGFSLAFLSISGIVVYVDMWLKRRKGGRKSPIWV
jgi:uncharacterized iron-regulated membrane protein